MYTYITSVNTLKSMSTYIFIYICIQVYIPIIKITLYRMGNVFCIGFTWKDGIGGEDRSLRNIII